MLTREQALTLKEWAVNWDRNQNLQIQQNHLESSSLEPRILKEEVGFEKKPTPPQPASCSENKTRKRRKA